MSFINKSLKVLPKSEIILQLKKGVLNDLKSQCSILLLLTTGLKNDPWRRVFYERLHQKIGQKQGELMK